MAVGQTSDRKVLVKAISLDIAAVVQDKVKKRYNKE